MPFRTQDSAVSRCPPEIWLEIFRTFHFVTFTTNCEDPMGAYAPDDDGIAREHRHISARRRKDTESTFVTLSSVCRTWKTLVTPFLYEWVFVDSWCGLERVQKLGGRLNEQYTLGSFVRRLDFVNLSMDMTDARTGTRLNSTKDQQYHPPEHFQLSYYISQHAMVAASVPEIVDQQFEGFTYHDSHFDAHTFLEILPGSTLKVLTISGSRQSITYSIAVRIIACCTLLTTLDLSRCQVRCDTANSSDDLDALTLVARSGPRALRSVSLYPTSTNASFFDFLASLDLTQLRNVSLNGTPQDTLAPARSFLRAHGNQIVSLELCRNYDSLNVGGSQRTLDVPLGTFPNLINLVTDVNTFEFLQLNNPHTTLERIGFPSHLIQASVARHSLSELWRSRTPVTSLVSEICSAPFPSLKSIRMLDIASPESFLTREHHSEEWLGLHSDLVRCCADRGVQLEDCIGRPFSLPRASAA